MVAAVGLDFLQIYNPGSIYNHENPWVFLAKLSKLILNIVDFHKFSISMLVYRKFRTVLPHSGHPPCSWADIMSKEVDCNHSFADPTDSLFSTHLFNWNLNICGKPFNWPSSNYKVQRLLFSIDWCPGMLKPFSWHFCDRDVVQVPNQFVGMYALDIGNVPCHGSTTG